MDSQENLTYSSNIDKPDKTITDVLGEECKVDEAFVTELLQQIGE